MKRAICIGLRKVVPAAYDGWYGDCPGADVDAVNCAKRATARGFAGVASLLDLAATRKAIGGTIVEQAQRLPDDPSSLLLITLSGHGTQRPDKSGDEDDGMDEAFCAADGLLIDDDFRAILRAVPPKVRIAIVTDSCTSGTFARKGADVVSLAVRGLPIAPKRRWGFWSRPPRLLTARTWVPSDFPNPVLHYAGCADGRVSYGDNAGGQWTNALLRSEAVGRAALDDGGRSWLSECWRRLFGKPKPLTWGGWFRAAAKLMPYSQVPTVTEYGPAAALADFKARRAME